MCFHGHRRITLQFDTRNLHRLEVVGKVAVALLLEKVSCLLIQWPQYLRAKTYLIVLIFNVFVPQRLVKPVLIIHLNYRLTQAREIRQSYPMHTRHRWTFRRKYWCFIEHLVEINLKRFDLAILAVSLRFQRIMLLPKSRCDHI